MADLGAAPEQPQRADDEEYLLRLGSHFRERVETDERFAGIHVLQQLSGNERRGIRGPGTGGGGGAGVAVLLVAAGVPLVVVGVVDQAGGDPGDRERDESPADQSKPGARLVSFWTLRRRRECAGDSSGRGEHGRHGPGSDPAGKRRPPPRG